VKDDLELRGPVSTPPPAMRLRDVVAEIPGAVLHSTDPRAGEVVVSGVRHDSRAVSPGDLFVARRGGTRDGLDFVPQAVVRGALAVMIDKSALAEASAVPSDVPVVLTEDVPLGLALASAAVYGHPTFGMEVVGITGTNGKTTVLHLIEAVLLEASMRPGVIGTLGARFESFESVSGFTSPEADELARLARRMRDRGASHLVMEVSSIALAAKRCDGVRFRAAVFTNLTQDHLDFHGSMEAYGAAKARLFTDFAPGAAVLNLDDSLGGSLVQRVPPGTRTVTYSKTDKGASVYATSLELSKKGVSLALVAAGTPLVIESALLGAHNAENLLATVALGVALELSLDRVCEALSRPISVPGRLTRCDDPALDDIAVVVDYAHTPDALARVLTSLRPFAAGGLTCVFGCGGDRDKAKRPLMGEVAGRLADRVILTNDNPRSERPVDIAAAVLEGLRGAAGEVTVELDRRAAIARAIREALPGGVVLVAGKGHEPYQIVGTETLPFDDTLEAKDALRARRGSNFAAPNSRSMT
jgi:UDP-N-acetylmuramoyl-L-alanyl-D-glutamate--2,6-diaminopimelate ligase